MSHLPLVVPAGDLSMDEVRRYSRHLIIPDVGMDGQKRLKNARVLCVGAGGLGSPALMYLAAAGVGTLGIIDFDVVDESNLQRQIIHGHSDVGRSKAESARESVTEINPFVQVNLHTERLDSSNAMELFAQYDLIVDGTDNFATRYLVNDACVLLGKPYVWGSIYRFDGQASVFWAEHGPCYRCLYPDPPPPGMVPSCAEGGVLGVLCASIGSIQVTEAIKLITGVGDSLLGRLMVFDAREMDYRQVTIRKDPNCAACGDTPTVTELIDYELFCGVTSDSAVTQFRTSRFRARLEGHARRASRRQSGFCAGGCSRAGRVEHRRYRWFGVHPQRRIPHRRGLREVAAGQAGGSLLQVGWSIRRGSRGRKGSRIRRNSRRWWHQRLGFGVRAGQADVLNFPGVRLLDPFDRMLVVQAMEDGVILSREPQLGAHDIDVVRADDLQRNVAVLPANIRRVPWDLSHGTFGRDGIDHVVHDAHLDRALDPPGNHFVLRCEFKLHLLA